MIKILILLSALIEFSPLLLLIPVRGRLQTKMLPNWVAFLFGGEWGIRTLPEIDV
jgi:hypothetical protein